MFENYEGIDFNKLPLKAGDIVISSHFPQPVTLIEDIITSKETGSIYFKSVFGKSLPNPWIYDYCGRAYRYDPYSCCHKITRLPKCDAQKVLRLKEKQTMCKFELGKYYKTGYGSKLYYLGRSSFGADRHYFEDENYDVISFHENGQITCNPAPSKYDIVSEWKEPVKVTKDYAHILVAHRICKPDLRVWELENDGTLQPGCFNTDTKYHDLKVGMKFGDYTVLGFKKVTVEIIEGEEGK